MTGIDLDMVRKITRNCRDLEYKERYTVKERLATYVCIDAFLLLNRGREDVVEEAARRYSLPLDYVARRYEALTKSVR